MKGTKPDPKKGDLYIEYVAIDDLTKWARNPKLHGEDALTASLKRFGFTNPFLYDETHGQLVAGHGRLEALERWQREGRDPPKRVRLDGDGRWLAPVVRGLEFSTEDEAAAYAIADNRLVELGGWDTSGLNDEMKRLYDSMGKATAFEITGFDAKALDELTAKMKADQRANAKRGAKPDDVPEVAKKAVSRTGDLWLLGGHRLLCGDSTKADDVARLMGGEKAVLMATDPPYGVAYDNSERPNPGVAKPRVANDEHTDGPKMQAFLEAMLQAAMPCMSDTAAFYFWHPMLTQGTYVAAAAAAAGILIHRQIIWVKPGLLLGRGDYHWRHELCFYGWRQGHRCAFYGQRNQDTVWNVGYDKDRNEWNHATPKPVALWERPLVNHVKPGETVYEPFSGSGSQIIAAEKAGAMCAAMEIVDLYVDVAARRWEKYTGKTATLDGDGRTFAEIAADRGVTA